MSERHRCYIGSNERDAKKISEALAEGPVTFSWTEGSTHFDIFMLPQFSVNTSFEAPLTGQNWLRYGMVMVGIAKKGCFYFELMSGVQEFKAEYVAEKLGLDAMGRTAQDIADFFNMISTNFKARRNLLV